MSQSPSNSSSNSNGEDNSLPQTSPSTWYVHIPLSPSYAHCNIILFDALCAALQAGRYQISSSPETTRGFVIEVRGRYTRPEAIWRAASLTFSLNINDESPLYTFKLSHSEPLSLLADTISNHQMDVSLPDYKTQHEVLCTPASPASSTKMGLIEFLQCLRGPKPTGHTWYVYFPLHGNPVTKSEIFETARQELRDKQITLRASRLGAPEDGMLMQVVVTENTEEEVLTAVSAVIDRQLQDARLSLERILQVDNDRRAYNRVANLEREAREARELGKGDKKERISVLIVGLFCG
ncbi:uncharacterized protein ACLA_022010 [Aspergillus clavatus NRRL 1]|uniref:Uncharacterized protein n=1 Tax=Aspergillus clavatus (strain ATCC 1007 / CBS 513.65 / DSM 816 / NCTC 3887 / NRRL 1 / QM 1276 / 107) TaxID=344612 RepID=A1CPB6_ASPCL|nr:uncharacterized protein ACLA_022010 [Aspergillus clavatus NRRL 1]EAW07487.1 conserved hypothetical protein [Aspergillus clavatus NRRL 1]